MVSEELTKAATYEKTKAKIRTTWVWTGYFFIIFLCNLKILFSRYIAWHNHNKEHILENNDLHSSSPLLPFAPQLFYSWHHHSIDTTYSIDTIIISAVLLPDLSKIFDTVGYFLLTEICPLTSVADLLSRLSSSTSVFSWWTLLDIPLLSILLALAFYPWFYFLLSCILSSGHLFQSLPSFSLLPGTGGKINAYVKWLFSIFPSESISFNLFQCKVLLLGWSENRSIGLNTHPNDGFQSMAWWSSSDRWDLQWFFWRYTLASSGAFFDSNLGDQCKVKLI